MKYLTITLFCLLGCNQAFSQAASPNYTTPPTATQVRTMAEWEEVQALIVTWTGTATGFPSVIKEIIRHAQEEVKVIVICSDSNQVKSYLNTYNIIPHNVTFIEDFYNSVWMQDYGATSIYGNNVDSLYLVDWIYNRPRPFDDRIPSVVATHENLPLYSTTHNPYDLVNTGGNFMSDGQGIAFASKLIIDENGPQGTYVNIPKTEAEVDSIMEDFMGIQQFIKLEKLDFNTINHIDMYMKLLNEETLLVGEYPTGVADGPKIETNIQYIQDNFYSTFGTPYRIVRVPMPPDTCGNYPDDYGPGCTPGSINSYWGHYRTFTNIVFINETVLVPVYSYQYDTVAIHILKKELPGYKIVGIDCNKIITYGGALHCVAKTVGVKNPLLIVHQPIRDTVVQPQGYQVTAKIQHTSQIQTATLFYSTDTAQGFQAAAMTQGVGDYWVGQIPTQTAGKTVYYYIKASSYSGKEQVRPITAPKGFWQFDIQTATSRHSIQTLGFDLHPVFPNPSGEKVIIPIQSKIKMDAVVKLFNIDGKLVKTIFSGQVDVGKTQLETSVNNLPNGTYFVVLQTDFGVKTQQLIKH